MEMKPQYLSHAVFSTTKAVSINGTFKGGIPTINIDFSDIINRHADWNNKVSFLVSEVEVPYFIGVLLGIIPSCDCRFHGTNNNKSFSLEMQGDGLYIKASAPGRSFGMKINPAHLFHITTMVMGHLKPNFYGLSVDEIGRLVRCTIGRYAA